MGAAEELGSFGSLAEAVGLTVNGELKGEWFQDPLGTANGSKRGLRSIVYTNAQREALVAFVDDVLGPPDRESDHDAVWVPLFTDSGATIYAVVEAAPGTARVGFGIEYETGTSTPSVSIKAHVPIFQMPREGGGALDVSGSQPDWLFLGRRDAYITLSLGVNISNAAPVAGELYLGGVDLSAAIPTNPADTFTLGVDLRRLQLPGTSTPRDFELNVDALDELGPDVLHFIIGLLQAQADALNPADTATAPFAALAGLLGIRSVTDIPGFPLEDFVSRGVPALIDWLESILTTTSSRTAWLNQLKDLVGGTVNSTRNSIEFSAGPVTGSVGLRIATATGGGIKLTPWVELALRPRTGAEARVTADVFTMDTTDGSIVALPDLEALAVFGHDAGLPSNILTGDPGLGSIHVGVTLRNGQPAFTLTAHDVTIAGHVHEVLDLSSPDAALDAASSVVNDALVNLLNGLGRPGQLSAILIGLSPPSGITGLSAAAVLANPIDAIKTYWASLLANTTAFAEVVTAVRELITGVSGAVAGAGSEVDPWVIDIDPVALHLWLDSNEIVIELAADVVTAVLTDYETVLGVRARLARFDVVDAKAQFLTRFAGAISIRRADSTTARFDLGPVDLVANAFGAEFAWSARDGVSFAVIATGLGIEIESADDISTTLPRIDLPLPVFHSDGSVEFTPNWPQIEIAIASLLGRLQSPVIDVLLNLIGWKDEGAHLLLADLVVDPVAALRAWIGELVVNCNNVSYALGPVAYLMSGFRIGRPIGSGNELDPFRAPIAAEPKAPGIAVWLDPGCPLHLQRYETFPGYFDTGRPPEEGELAAALQSATTALPEVRDLLVGRDSLDQGLQQLSDRITGTDGLIGQPVVLPDGVTGIDINGYSYRELVAMGAINVIPNEALDAIPSALIYVGCEELWASNFAGNSIDARTAIPTTPIGATATGVWSLALPTPEQAAADRPDRGAIIEQAERLKAVLAGRTAAITVIGYGAAGAACIKAAQDIVSIERVVTVGTPWTPLATSGFSSGLSGDALRLLAQIRRPIEDELTEELLAGEATPLIQIQHIIERAILAAGFTGASLGDIPDASAQTRRAGLIVNAVFGQMNADDVDTGLAALVADSINYRYEIHQQPAEPATALHLGVDLPVIDLDIGGLLLGAGATVELVSFDRGAGDSFAVHTDQILILDLHFGVHDGWLVGGPGAEQHDVELRWMSARLHIPLSASAAPASAQLILHEASCFGVQRESWIVELGADGISATLPTSEVHILLAAVVDRLSLASADFTNLLAAIGIIRSGGYDPSGLERLLFDTRVTLTDALTSKALDIAASLRGLSGISGSGSTLNWVIDAATVGIDLQARSLQIDVSHALPDLPPIELSATLNTQGITIGAALGEVDTQKGGLQLAAAYDTTGLHNTTVGINWQLPGAASMSTIDLLSLANIQDLIKLSAALVPSTLIAGFIDNLRDRVEQDARTALETLLDSLTLLGPVPEFGQRRILLPWALFLDPIAWIQHAAGPWQADPFGQAVATLEALVPLVAPTRTGTGWPLSDDVTLTYSVESGQLRLGVDLATSFTLDSAALQFSINGGLAINTAGSVSPLLSTAVSFDERGLALAISPSIQLNLLRPSPTPPMQIYPAGPGLGSLLATGAGMAIPIALNALIAERSGSASLLRDVAQAVFDLGGALNLLESNQFAESKITTFAADPVSALMTQLPAIASAAVANLVAALDPAATLVKAITEAPGKVRLEFGATTPIALLLDGSAAIPAVQLAGEIDIADVGVLSFDSVRIAQNGVQVTASFIAHGFNVGNGLELMPVFVAHAGISSAGFDRLMGIGLATDGVGDQSVEFRWALDATPPRAVVVNRSGVSETEDSNVEHVALALLSQAISMALSVALEALDPLGTQVVDVLQDVAFTGGGPTLDTQLFIDFADADALLHRVYQLAYNLADQDIKITIDSKFDIGFTRNGNRAGVFASLTPGQRIALSSGDPNVDLEIVASWITSGADPGLSIYLIEKVGDNFNLNASFALAGLGVRVSKTSGPLLNFGIMSINAIGVHTYGELAPAGIGAGVQVQLDGLSLSPSAAGGDNAVANNLMSDAASSASPSTRPSFSPTIAIQKAPGGNVGVSLSAGEPPGPWWLVIQRQLGPLYLEQFGFDVTETDGNVTGISLLFDARVSLFGLDAQVDDLGLHWLGGDIFDLSKWAVDLKGLAVSGEFTGASISGGLLKTDMDGSIGYVGMLTGRFGVYGLSLFGGYNDDKGLPSFFVFGAIVGPIGGPPAFFLTGIGGGLGIKRGLKVPDDLSKFGEYPFIKALDPAAKPSTKPLDQLRELAEYFPPEAGNMWFAAGISFNSFALVDGVAVLSVSFGNGLEINLFGLARLALPRPQAPLVSIELGLLARFSTNEGLFLIQAQLTDNSWLLYPEVKLTGGFAFATWWKGDKAGQFVLTMGGYHPSFSRSGYPVVPRLGLVWRISNQIVIKGGCYFALTSEALMAGVEVEVSADFGFVWAKISFGANAIVYFDPFYFMADAYARISAGIKIKTFFGTIRISISIGARIEVEGPNFHGRATIEIGPCDVTVPFGNTSSFKGNYVDWAGFVPKYLELGTSGGARAISGITGKGSLPAATDGETSAPSCDGSVEHPFEVFAEFDMSVVTTIPVTLFDFGSSSINKPVQPKLPSGSSTSLGISPMNASDLGSTLQFILQKKSGSSWTNRTADLAKLVGNNMVQDTAGTDGPSFGVDSFPIGVWGLPEDADQPSSKIPKGDVISAGSRVKLVATANLTGKTGPEIDYYRVESGRRPLPLSATGSSRDVLLTRADGLGVIVIATSTQQAFELADQRLFVETTTASIPGLISSGQRSATARAGYMRSRTAPPLFGTLAEGIVSMNEAKATSEQMPAKPAPAPSSPRAPFITGYMTGGAGVAKRVVATTVTDHRIKRRPAPSTDSVQGRIGRSLPIRLSSKAAPSVVGDTTIIVRGTVPRTDVAGVVRSYRGGHVGSAVGGALVTGLSARVSARATHSGKQPQALEPGSRLRPGDVVSMRLPDAVIDIDGERPLLKVDGNARVVMLKGNGYVVGDQLVSNATIEIAPRTAIVTVQADGGVDDMKTGGITILGWHDQSRVIRLGNRSVLAAGCVMNIEAATAKPRIGWSVAGDVVRNAAAVVTRFDSEITTVGVMVRSTDAQRIEDMAIELHGADRVMTAGKPDAPVVVHMGSRTLLLFEVIPEVQRPDISVRITAGGTRQISGVIGSIASVNQVADLVAERGIVAVVTRLRAASGDGCSLAWVQPEVPQVPTAPTGVGVTSSGVVTTGGVAQPASQSSQGKKKPKKKQTAEQHDATDTAKLDQDSE